MQLIAKLTQLLPLQTGSGKNGEWKKQDIIVETEGQFPKKICISIWGDKINDNSLQIGKKLKIEFDVESREYNNKWYTDVKAWKIEGIDPIIQEKVTTEVGNPTFSNDLNMLKMDKNDDDLPF